MINSLLCLPPSGLFPGLRVRHEVPELGSTESVMTAGGKEEEEVGVTRSVEPRRERALLNAAQESLAVQIRSESQSNGKIFFLFVFFMFCCF